MRVFACLTIVLATLAGVSMTHAQEQGEGAMSLFMTYRCKPENRVRFREYVAGAGVRQFEAWKRQGVYRDYRILFSAFVNSGDTAPDMVVRLDFARYADSAQWKVVERTRPGGLTAEALALCPPVTSDLADLSYEGPPSGARDLSKAVYLWIPYHLQEGVGKPEYKQYFETYVKPQNDGWLKEGALSWWGVYLNQHNTGKPWDIAFLYEYSDITGLARRDNVKQAVRAQLRNDPVWKRVSDGKQSIRREDQVIIMDPILPADETPLTSALTKRFEIRDDRAYLDGHEIKLWGIRAGNALMSPAVTERFVRNLDNMAAHGINALLVYIMGSNTGWPEEWGARNGFERDGRLKPAVAQRLEWLIREADQRGMVIGVGIFTPRNVANMDGDDAYKRALQETGRFLKERGLRNVLVDIMHEYNHRRVGPDLFKEPDGAAKKAKLHQWLKEANPEVSAGVCPTIDSGTSYSYPGADLNIIQKTMPIPASGFTINVELQKRDNYDRDGVYSEQALAENYGWFESYQRAPNAALFFHSAFITGVTGRDGSAPHAEMGGYGRSAEDAGVRWYYEWVRDHVGRWEYPNHVPVNSSLQVTAR